MARATVLSAMLGVVVFGAVRLASARDGVPGFARTWVTFAGVVSGLPGDPRTANMRFSFHRTGTGADAGVLPSLCSPTVRDVSISTTGAFSAQIPLDDPGSPCPSDIFDGRDVQVDVDVGAETLVRNAPVNPVPYAHFATNAGRASIAASAASADRLAFGPRFIWDFMGTPFQWTRPDGGGDVDIPVPGLRLRLPTAGTYLLIFSARFFGTGYGDGGRDDLNTVSLVVRGRPVARQSLPGYMSEVDRQRTGGVTIVTPYVATAGDEVTVLVLAAPGVRSIEFASGSTGDDGARLIAIPMVEGL